MGNVCSKRPCRRGLRETLIQGLCHGDLCRQTGAWAGHADTQRADQPERSGSLSALLLEMRHAGGAPGLVRAASFPL